MERNSGNKQPSGRPRAQAEWLARARAFARDRRGAFAMQFALMVVPLFICTGLAIDGGRSFLARYELGQALDAAALAIGSTEAVDGEEGDEALKAVAEKYVALNFKTPHDGDVDVGIVRDGDVINLTGAVTIDTYFMPLIGRPTVELAAASEVRRGGGNVEVALALDVTASMTMGVDRMTPLRAAATSLVNTVVNDEQAPFFSRVAIIPWASNVHVGSSLVSELRGAVTGPVNISGADWRIGTAKTITKAHWRDGNAALVTAAAWRSGAAKTATTVSKVTAAGATQNRTLVTLNNHGFTNNDYIRITGSNGGFGTATNNIVFQVADATANNFYLKRLDTTYLIVSGSPANSTASNLQECYNSTCLIQVTTGTTAHGFSTGDRIYISGIQGMTAINNANGATWTVTANTTTTFLINEINGPGNSQTWSTGGTAANKLAAECFDAACRVQITAANHGFVNNDRVFIQNVGGFTAANSAAGTSWAVANPTTNAFYLSGTWGPGLSLAAYTSGGTATKCITTACEVQVTTSAAHGIANNEWVRIAGVSGMTNINYGTTASWQATAVSSTTMILSGSRGPSFNPYSGNGTTQCLVAGCEWIRYARAGNGTIMYKQISDCVTERVSDEEYTEAPPSTAPLGPYYPSGGYNVCGTTNRITPLTSNKPALVDAIADMVVTGSTAGQVGLAWGWYMLSPEWADVWSDYASSVDDDYADPVTYSAGVDYETPKLSKVLVLMTDGDFNTAHCNGVASQSYGGAPDLINCAPTNGQSFAQALELCAAIDAKDITIFTIGFQVGATSAAAEFLEDCASAPENFFLSTDGNDLQDDFDKIGKAISKLRISR